MKYRIGDVERILGISAETLRYFEKKGIIIPHKNETNSYRYFDTLDMNKLVAYKFFRGMEFSMDESAEMVNSISNTESVDRMNQQIYVIENRINYYNGLLARMNELKNSFKNADTMVNKFCITNSPEILLYYNQVNDAFGTGEQQIKNTHKWLSYLPFVWLALHIPKEEVPLGDIVHWGYAVRSEHKEIAEQLGKLLLTIKVPSKKSVYTVYECCDNQVMTPELLGSAMDFIEENGLVLCGDVIGCIINEDKNSSGTYRYFEVWLPVADK